MKPSAATAHCANSVAIVKYTRFEELPAWQAATRLSLAVYAFSAKPPLRRLRALRDQIERASVSVSNNIAEGFERGTTQELLTFLYIARGSAGEVRSMLCLMERMDDCSNLKSEISNLKLLAEGVSRQLRAWAQALQDSSIKGTRYLTSKTRKLDEARREREAFLQELRGNACPARPRKVDYPLLSDRRVPRLPAEVNFRYFVADSDDV